MRRMFPARPGTYISVISSRFGSLPCMSLSSPRHDAQHQATHAQLVAVAQEGLLLASAVHQGSVRASEVLHEDG